MFLVSRLIGLPAYQEHVGGWTGDSYWGSPGDPLLVRRGSLVLLATRVVARRRAKE